MGLLAIVGAVTSRVPLVLRAAGWVGSSRSESSDEISLISEDGETSDDYESANSSPQARQLVHNRLLSNRNSGGIEGIPEENGCCRRYSGENGSVDGSVDGSVEGSINGHISSHVDRYLSDQNKKFDDLIYKNLNAVLVQSGHNEEKEAETSTFRKSVSGVVSSGMGGLAGRIRFFGHKKDVDIAEATTPPEEAQEFVSPALNSAMTFDSFLDSLDYDTKIQLLKMLRRDLGLTNDDELERLVLNENDIEKLTSMHKFETTGPVIDKIQLFVLILIKLMFIGLKLMIPISYLIYTKFVENQLFLFNNKNFNKMLLVCIKVMRTLEHKLNDEKIQPYQYGYDRTQALEKDIKFTQAQQNLDELYDEMTLNATSFFIQYMDMAERSSWTRSVFGYMVSKYLGAAKTQQPPPPTKPLHASPPLHNDPKFSKYFATPPSTSNGAPSSPGLGSRSLPGSSVNLNSLSVMELAQQFANELI